MALSPKLLAMLVKATTECYVRRKTILEEQIDEALSELEQLEKPHIRVPAIYRRA